MDYGLYVQIKSKKKGELYFQLYQNKQNNTLKKVELNK